MSEAVARSIQRAGVLPAFLAALGIFFALLVQGFLGSVFASLSLIAETTRDGEFFGQL